MDGTGPVYYYVDRAMRAITAIRMELTMILWAVSVGTSAEKVYFRLTASYKILKINHSVEFADFFFLLFDLH